MSIQFLFHHCVHVARSPRLHGVKCVIALCFAQLCSVGVEGAGRDICCVCCLLLQLKEARAIVLEVERGILPALLSQLSSPSVNRRRGTIGTIR